MRGILGELQAELADVPGAMVVVDMEAGLEHLSRGTLRFTDALLVIAEPFFRSAETAVRTAKLGLELGIPSVGVVANKVRDDADADNVRQIFERAEVPIVAVVPHDEAVGTADRAATSVVDHDPEAPIVKALERLVDDLLAANGREAAAG